MDQPWLMKTLIDTKTLGKVRTEWDKHIAIKFKSDMDVFNIMHAF